MESVNKFLADNYLIFAIASLFLLFALIGYFIEKKNADKKLAKTEELKTINIQEQVNQMNSNVEMQNATVDQTQIGVQSSIQPTVQAENMANNIVQPVQSQSVEQPQIVSNQVNQPQTNMADQNDSSNIEIL